MASPYLTAHARYHADGPPHIPWADALDFHLQHGVVISTPDLFLMARPVPDSSPDSDHVILCHWGWQPYDTTWHVWAVSGDLKQICQIPESLRIRVRTLTFQRRTGRVHRWPFARLQALAGVL